MDFMHESMVRLYEAAQLLAEISGQSALAARLAESPQTVNNWESRGISSAGALKAQAGIGCNANWLLSGVGSMALDWPFTSVPLARFLALPDKQQGYVEAKLGQAMDEAEAHAKAKQVLHGLGARKGAMPDAEVAKHLPPAPPVRPASFDTNPAKRKPVARKRAA
jgi:hypothetical protein